MHYGITSGERGAKPSFLGHYTSNINLMIKITKNEESHHMRSHTSINVPWGFLRGEVLCLPPNIISARLIKRYCSSTNPSNGSCFFGYQMSGSPAGNSNPFRENTGYQILKSSERIFSYHIFFNISEHWNN